MCGCCYGKIWVYRKVLIKLFIIIDKVWKGILVIMYVFCKVYDWICKVELKFKFILVKVRCIMGKNEF